uniref:Uncharacterized protein n=1 Tax=Glossina pallidipes TaxID=7398 RepID=A0A1A9Z2F2_GLOPL
MRILKDFLMSRVIACMQQPSITRKVLKEGDCKIRVFIRNTLHLKIHCHNSVVYAAVGDGGSGIFCLHERIPGVVLQRINKLRERDELFASLIQADSILLVRIENLRSPISSKAATREHHAAALNASFSGCNGLKQVANNKLSTQWLYDLPSFWSGEDYVKAVQLRYNLLPWNGIPSNPIAERRCRGEHCRRQETVCHILQACSTTHVDRINRHDTVQDIIDARSRKQGWAVDIEKHVYGRDGIMRKPDLILSKNNQVIVSDVGIHWEGEESLQHFYDAKVNHYSSEGFIGKVTELYPGKTISALYNGSEGSLMQEQQQTNLLNMTQEEIKTIVGYVLKGNSTLTFHETCMEATQL